MAKRLSMSIFSQPASQPVRQSSYWQSLPFWGKADVNKSAAVATT